ncbi:hypothetical protein V5799_015053 [Amblyomma americanum]|uniref:Methyltransferase type 11 domain-containing protein n=1 Tax=Amblyomma americanum TaxID=6943 RepID=A0AAQ4E191_AMBAM
MERWVPGYGEDMHQVPDDHFDVVLVTHLLCSVNCAEKVLQECRRVLVKGTSAASSSEPSPLRRFIVYENCLLQLTNLYRKCHHPAQSSLKAIGCLVVTICPNMHSTKWYGQPTQRRIGHGNVRLDAAILFTGCSPTQSLRLVENADICFFSKRTYDRIQKDILFSTVYKVCMFKL